MKEGIVFETFDDTEGNTALAMINTIDIRKVAEREAHSDYIYPPLKRSWLPTVRIVSLVMLAVKRFKRLLLLSKIRSGKAQAEEIKKFDETNVKFTAFHLYSEDQKKIKSEAEENNEKKITVKLTDEDLSSGLEYLYKKATQEIIHFEDKKDIERNGVMKDEILYCKSRILEGASLKAVGALSECIDLETFTGIKFKVPLISKHSPLAVSVAMHLHYNVNKHRGYETTYRLSLQNVRILQGRQIFKDVSDDCIFCKKLRIKYVKQLMGPLADTQLSISPIFYFTYLDMWGPISVFCPGYEKVTRNRAQQYDVHMLVMACAATGTVNCQVIEKKDTEFVLDGLNRFFNEVCVPKICYPDQDGALMKALREGEIDLQDLQGRLHREKGIYFETCLPQGHSAHGRIEAKIKTLQETLERSGMKGSRCTATGWQTIAKAIEREVNGVPLGFLHHQGTANPLLRVLCPSLLKNSTFTDRAPKGLFKIPDSVDGMMTKIEDIYNLWFKIWNVEYVPLIMNRQKWHVETDNLVVNDLVYFKMTDSPLKADWKLGKVEYTKLGRDGLVRELGISYSHKDTEDDWTHYTVERPVRMVVKLMNVEDTSILDDMEEVYKMSKQVLLEKNQPKPVDLNDDEIESIDELRSNIDEFSTPEEENTISENPEPEENVIDKADAEKKTRGKSRKTEVEKLKILNKEFDTPVDGTRRKMRKAIATYRVQNNAAKPKKTSWTNLNLFNIISNLNQNKDESEEKVENLYFNLNNSSSDSEAKDEVYNISVTNNKAREEMTITWPAVVTHESQIGEVTSALCSGVTELISKGCTVRNVRGDVVGQEKDGDIENNVDCDKYSVLLM